MKTKTGDKANLKEKILKDSTKAFKKMGRSGAPVDQIMKGIGLTSGALYSHFKGKADLFHSVVLFDLNELVIRFEKEIFLDKEVGLKNIVNGYLSEKHINNPEYSCLFITLGSDLYRGSEKEKVKYESKIKELFDVLGEGFKSGTKAERKNKGQLIFSMMVGSMTLARSINFDKFSIEILNNSRKKIIEMID